MEPPSVEKVSAPREVVIEDTRNNIEEIHKRNNRQRQDKKQHLAERKKTPAVSITLEEEEHSLEFDLRKAVIYAEVLKRPKFQEY